MSDSLISVIKCPACGEIYEAKVSHDCQPALNLRDVRDQLEAIKRRVDYILAELNKHL